MKVTTIVQCLAIVVMAIGMLALIGYAAHAPILYTWKVSYVPMSICSAVCWPLVGLALLLSTLKEKR